MAEDKNTGRIDRIDAFLVRHKFKDASLSMSQYASYLMIIVCLLCTVLGLLMDVYAIIRHSERVGSTAVSMVTWSLVIVFAVAVYRLRDESYNRMMRVVTLVFTLYYCLIAGVAGRAMRQGSPEGNSRSVLGLIIVYCLVQGFFAFWMFMKLWRAKHNENIQQYVRKWKFYQYLMLFFGVVYYLSDGLLHVALPKSLVGSFIALMCLTQAKDLYLMDAIPRVDDTASGEIVSTDVTEGVER